MEEQQMDWYMYEGGIANVGASDWDNEPSYSDGILAVTSAEADYLKNQHKIFEKKVN